ncbi:MAG: ATP-binding protein [Clostridia bacterium]|nr:ATP-binding protein [Clostridia bacterium]
MAENITKMTVPKRILRTLLTSLTAGVVPRSGAPYIAIGRKAESDALLDSLEAAGEGGSSIRFLIGRYGSGKSFLLQLVRGYALDRDFLCADADLSPERRLSGGNGGGLATYRELLRNLASRSSPEGGALPVVLSRYYASLANALAEEGIFPEDAAFTTEMKKRIYATLSSLEGGVGGFDLARVLGAYYSAEMEGDNEKKSACLRWIRGEFGTKTEARAALGIAVGGIIGDDNWYDYIKLLAVFARRLGYRGLLVLIDECVNLYKIPNRIAREANYEKLLSIFNDTLGGRAEGLCFVFGGTAQFLEDTRRGLFSYEALRSRLSDSRFAEGGYTTMTSPVIRLRRLSDNELLALVVRLASLHTELYGTPVLPAADAEAFLRRELDRAGAEEMVTPREIIRDFLSLLDILRENPTATFGALLAVGASAPTATPLDTPHLGTAPSDTAAPTAAPEAVAKEPKKSSFFFDLSL